MGGIRLSGPTPTVAQQAGGASFRARPNDSLCGCGRKRCSGLVYRYCSFPCFGWAGDGSRMKLMRGDSVRDLYAKALALVGLSLLAGAGAIVDYWPVSGDMPRVVAAPNRLPSVARVPRAANVSVTPPVAARVMAVTAARPAPVTPDVISAAAAPELFVSMPTAAAPTASAPIGHSVGLTIPAMIPAPVEDAPASDVELSQLPANWARERS